MEDIPLVMKSAMPAPSQPPTYDPQAGCEIGYRKQRYCNPLLHCLKPAIRQAQQTPADRRENHHEGSLFGHSGRW